MTARDDAEKPLAPVVDLLGGRRSSADRGDPTDALFDSLRSEAESLSSDDELLAALSPAIPDPPVPLRAGISLLALAQLIVVLPWLVDTDPFGLLGDSHGSHMTRDGALGLVVSVAALLTAWRPRWALPSFLTASAALIAQAAAGIIDSEGASGGTELVHLPSVVLACMIGLSMIRLADLRPSNQPPR